MNNQLPKTLFPFIWHFLRSHKRIVVFAASLSVTAGFWGPLNSVLIKQLIDLLPTYPDGNMALLVWPSALIVINFIVFDNFTWRSINYIWAKYVPIIQNKIIAVMLDYVLSQSNGFYQNTLSGKISKQITNLSDGIVDIITFKMTNFLRGASLLVAAFVAGYYVNAIFCLILIAWFIIFATISISISKKIVTFADQLAAEETIVVGELVDSLSNHPNVRIFGRKSYENLRMLPFFEKHRQRYYALNIYSCLLYCIQGGLIASMMAASVFALVQLYGKGLVTVGDFALILGLSMETGHMTWFLMGAVDQFNKEAGKCKQSLTSLIVPLEICDKPDATVLRCTKGQIIFENVTFQYKVQPRPEASVDVRTEPLFRNHSIEIQPGQKVGLVGYSGGGKSTFVNLILRLYEVTEGAVRIDGQDIRTVTQDSLRIYGHKVFKGFAARGKSTMGWFFGFKLHLLMNEKGEWLKVALTPGNVDDRKPVRELTSKLTGLLFGDKGYIDKNLFQDLYERGLKLITGVKKNMQNKLLMWREKILLRKRAIIETVNGVLKENFQLCPTRHRSFINGWIHIFSTLVAYAIKSKKPAIKLQNLIPNQPCCKFFNLALAITIILRITATKATIFFLPLLIKFS